MTEQKLLRSLAEVTDRYRNMGVKVGTPTLAVLIVNHAIGDSRKYRGDKEYWSMVGKVEQWLKSG